MDNNEVPLWLWRAFIYCLAGAGIVFVVTIAAVLLGLTNPRPVGDLVAEENGEAALEQWQRAKGQVPGSRIYLAAPFQVDAPGSVEIVVNKVEGPAIDAYGVWWGAQPGRSHAGVGLNGNGYLAVWVSDGLTDSYIREWIPYPHVRRDNEANRIRIDLTGGEATVWLNNEYVLAFPWDLPGPQQAGVYTGPVFDVQSSTAVLRVESLRIWQE